MSNRLSVLCCYAVCLVCSSLAAQMPAQDLQPTHPSPEAAANQDASQDQNPGVSQQDEPAAQEAPSTDLSQPINPEKDKSPRQLAHERQNVQRPLRAAQEAFEKAAAKIAEIVEKDQTYLDAIRLKDGVVPTEAQRNAARREAVARAKDNKEVRKLLEEARKHFEDYKKALDTALKSLEKSS